jgi:DNA-binding MarR family transcriptional regulator
MANSPTAVDVAAALYASIGLLVQRVRHAPAPGALTLPERSALERLARGGPATAAELARSEQITPQAMSATIAALERRGLVERQPDPNDGRRAITSVRPAGRKLLRRKHDVRAQQLAAVLREFTPAELATLAAAAPLIDRLAEGL